MLLESQIGDKIVVRLFSSIDKVGGDFTALTVSDLRKRTKPPSRKPIPVSVKDLTTQKISQFESVEAFAKTVRSKKNTIQSSVLRNNGKWKHFEIRYLDKKQVPALSN